MVQPQLKEALDLTDYQIEVYVSLISESATATQLCKRLGMNRSTVYRILDELEALSLIIKKQTEKHIIFEALHPNSLNDLYKKRLSTMESQASILEKMVQELVIQAKENPTEASISIEKGLMAHYNRMNLQLTCKEKVLRVKLNNDSTIYSVEKYPNGQNYMDFMNDYVRKAVKTGIQHNILTNMSLSSNVRSFNITNPAELKDVRISPSELLPNLGFVIFDDYTIFTVRNEKPEDMIVITIRNAIVAASMKGLFDFIYERSINTYQKLPIPEFTTKSGIKLPVMGIGTSEIGGHWNMLHPYIDDIGDLDQLRHSLSKGMRYIDTCLMYGEGHTVELVAKAINSIPRSELYINSKITRIQGRLVNSSKEIVEQCDRYLKILGVDYIDQLEIHSPKTLAIPAEEAVHEIERLITAGKVKNWAVSNYHLEELKEICSLSKVKPIANEIPYGVFMRDYEVDGTIDWMHKKNMVTIAFFTIRKGGMLVDQFFGTEKDSLLLKLAEKYKKTATQIAINWVIHQKDTIALIKSTNGTHVNENVGALGWVMEEGDYDEISRISLQEN
jgi:diketogulonate reductase-like aldo/keto reductase/sugar-specific transcriptional regulator TrmB